MPLTRIEKIEKWNNLKNNMIFVQEQELKITNGEHPFGQGDRGRKDNLDCKFGFVKRLSTQCAGRHCGQLHMYMAKLFPNIAYASYNKSMVNKLRGSWDSEEGTGALQSQPV